MVWCFTFQCLLMFPVLSWIQNETAFKRPLGWRKPGNNLIRWSSRHFVQIGQCGPIFQFINHIWDKDRALADFCLTLSKVNKGVICESYLSHMVRLGFGIKIFPRTQKFGVNILTTDSFEEHRAQVQFNIVSRKYYARQ